jgi:rod shape-determining protein MreD
MSVYIQVAALWTIRQAWLSMPLVAAVAGMLIGMAPANLGRGVVPAPDFVLICVFFWAIYGPSLLPPWAVFLVGLIQDFATGGPIGFWALIYLAAYGFTLSQRVFFSGRSGPGVWIGFAMVAGVTAVVAWVLGSMSYARWMMPWPIIMQAAITILVYPIVARVLTYLRGTLTTAREAL